ncbi:MAG: ribulose 1,5-bisphosphate carboxylase [Deltaproteobacteria bacterium]|nr:ribulose 1,5-bisphosphate carboxylase [Deltaproteobacteria bacterium]
MNEQDIKGFFADEEDLIHDDYLFFTFWFETAEKPEHAVAELACELSTAQWKRPGIDEDYRPRHAAKVVHLEILSEARRPSFMTSFAKGDHFYRGLVRLAYPQINIGPRLPNLLTTVCGEGAFFCKAISAVKLVDIDFPASWLADFQGPRFGIEGLRGILDVYDRPIFLGVVKPNIGLDPKSFAGIAYESWIGGLDIAKDDEMLGDTTWSPLIRRCREVGRKRKEAEDLTGEKKIYLANITDEVDRLRELHDLAVREGANAVMVNAEPVGLSALRMLAKHASVPVVAHFAGIAPMTRLPYYGVSSIVLTKLQRLAGADLIIVPGFGGRMKTEEEEVLDTVDACTEPFGHCKRSLPTPGGSDWAGTLPLVSEKLRSHEFGFICGRGVFNHPMGPTAGAASLRQAWEAIVQRLPLADYAADHRELEVALEAFGGNGVSEPPKKAVAPAGAVPLVEFLSMVNR